MIDVVKNELIEYGKLAGVKNFTPGFSGNLSARCGNEILITATGTANGYLSETLNNAWFSPLITLISQSPRYFS